MRWPWRSVRGALQAMAGRPGRREPVVVRYVDPTSGRAPLRTMGCEAQWLRPGEATPRQRRTAGAVYQVIEGRGQTVVGDTTFAWGPGDTLVAPPWTWVTHRNPGTAPAALFQFNDEPALQALGLWEEETEG